MNRDMFFVLLWFIGNLVTIVLVVAGLAILWYLAFTLGMECALDPECKEIVDDFLKGR